MLTLIGSDSLVVVQGITSKAQKWRRDDWHGSGGPDNHMDLLQQLLGEIETQGSSVQWLQVPSHIGVRGNDNADLLVDMGHRCSPLLRGYVTASKAILDMLDNEPESDPESDVGACPLCTDLVCATVQQVKTINSDS